MVYEWSIRLERYTLILWDTVFGTSVPLKEDKGEVIHLVMHLTIFPFICLSVSSIHPPIIPVSIHFCCLYWSLTLLFQQAVSFHVSGHNVCWQPQVIHTNIEGISLPLSACQCQGEETLLAFVESHALSHCVQKNKILPIVGLSDVHPCN